MPDMTETLTETLTGYARSTSPESIPEEVRERAKRVILDELASSYFGRRRKAGQLAATYSASFGLTDEAQIIGTDMRVSAPYAALANGSAGHADEIDGAHLVGGHPGATIVHSTLAIAERAQVSGSEYLNAVVLAYDVGTRMLDACGGIFEMKRRSHLHADFLYSLGATLANARQLQLDPAAYRHALALATFQANGLCALFNERHHISKAVCNGQYAFAGVSAVLMAQAGMEGAEDILGEQHGVVDAWGLEDAGDRMLRDLGKDFTIMGANFKMVRAGYPIHSAVEAAMTVVSQHGLSVDDITAVEVGMPENPMRVVNDRDMHNICLQDMMSVALLDGGLDLAKDYFPAALEDPRFSAMRSRVTLEVDRELDVSQPNGRGSRVTISTKAGGRHSHVVEAPKGHSSRGGLSWSDLETKWGSALPDVDTAAMIKAVRELESFDDIREVAAAFAQS